MNIWSHLKTWLTTLFTLSLFLTILTSPLKAVENLTEFDIKVKNIAESCRDELQKEMKSFISTNRLSMSQLFDTFYIPIPDTNPQKYHTQYDSITDEEFRIILDKCLALDKRFLFVVAVDRNGYLPTHNTKYSKPLTNNQNYNTKNNRTKRIFNDRTGLAAARNKQAYLLQKYNRDTGEMLADLSVPININGKHWGALRIGYRR